MKMNLELEVELGELPDWANWLAVDEDGSIWVYESEPSIDVEGIVHVANDWHPTDSTLLLDCLFENLHPMIYKNWKNSKIKIK